MDETGYQVELILKKKMMGASFEEKEQLREQLVKLYVQQAEYFKLSDQPNYKVAHQYLEKALRLNRRHPIANYRLGYIEYVDENWSKAIHHLNLALDGTDLEAISEVQYTLAHMFLVNCGIGLARESLEEIEFKELQHGQEEEKKIEQYRNTLNVQEEGLFDRLYYRKMQQGKESILSEQAFREYKPAQDEIVLKSAEDGMALLPPDSLPIPLRPNQFYTLLILMTLKQTTYLTLQEHLTELLGQQVSYDNVRQLITRLKRHVPLFKSLVDSGTIFSPDGSRITRFQPSPDWRLTVLCRADQFMKIE